MVNRNVYGSENYVCSCLANCTRTRLDDETNSVSSFQHPRECWPQLSQRVSGEGSDGTDPIRVACRRARDAVS